MQYKRKYLNTEKANILESDLKRQPIFLRRKYRPPQANSANHHKVLEKKQINIIKADIEELKFYATEAEQKCTSFDEQIEANIAKLPNPTDRETLRHAWLEEVTHSMPKSEEMCHRRLNYLSELHRIDPYKGYSVRKKEDHKTQDFQRGPRRQQYSHKPETRTRSGK